MRAYDLNKVEVYKIINFPKLIYITNAGIQTY